MARFGRGQPHAPIFLRNALAAAVVVVSAPQIHVILSPRVPVARRSTTTSVIYLRPARAVETPGTAAPAIHVIQGRVRAKHPSRDAKVVQLRTAPAAATAPAVRSHVITAPRSNRRPVARVETLRNAAEPPPAPFVRPTIVIVADPGRRQRGRVIQVRNPADQPDFDDRGPGQQIVQRSGRDPVRRRGDVVFVRNAAAPAVVGEAPAVRIHVVSTYRLKRPATRVIKLRNAPEQLVFPEVGAPAIHVIQGRARARHAARDVDVVFRRAPIPDVVVGQAPVVRIHVVTPYKLKRPVTHVVKLRNAEPQSVFPEVGAPQIHVVHARSRAQSPARNVDVIFLRIPVQPVVFAAPAVRIHVVTPYRLKRPTVSVTNRRAHLVDPPPPPPANILQFRYDP